MLHIFQWIPDFETLLRDDASNAKACRFFYCSVPGTQHVRYSSDSFCPCREGKSSAPQLPFNRLLASTCPECCPLPTAAAKVKTSSKPGRGNKWKVRLNLRANKCIPSHVLIVLVGAHESETSAVRLLLMNVSFPLVGTRIKVCWGCTYI